MSERQIYFIKQKLYGVIMILLGLLPMFIYGDGTATLLTTPIGLYLIFSKKMCIMDSYYYRMQSRRKRVS